jgi:preprotein translocase subunit SecG
MLLGLLLTLNIVVCLALIGVVLLQRSEGGALGGGGSPTGLITTRGAGDLLTRTTWILFSLFLALSLALTLLGGHQRSSDAFANRLKNLTINPNAVRRAAPSPQPGAPPPAGGASTPATPRPTVNLPPPGGSPPIPTTTGGFLPPRPMVNLPPSSPAPAPAAPAPKAP